VQGLAAGTAGVAVRNFLDGELSATREGMHVYGVISLAFRQCRKGAALASGGHDGPVMRPSEWFPAPTGDGALRSHAA